MVRRVLVVVGVLCCVASCDDGGSSSGADGVFDGQLVVVTSNYTSARLGLLDLATGEVTLGVEGDATLDGDLGVAAWGDSIALLERTTGQLKLQQAGAPLVTAATLSLNAEGVTADYLTNPQVLAPTSSTRGYVAALKRNELLVVERGADASDGAEVADAIDLSSFVRSGDTDGIVDVADVAVIGDRAYVALANYWFDADWVQHFTGSEVLMLDAASGELIDADPDAAGAQAIELAAENPWRGLRADPAGASLLVGAAGDVVALDGGIERVNLASMVSEGFVLTEEQLGGGLEGFAFVDETLWVLTAVAVPESGTAGSLARWDLGSGEWVGDAIGGVPGDDISGFIAVGGEIFAWGASGVRRFNGASGEETTPVAGPWTFGALPVVGMAVVP